MDFTKIIQKKLQEKDKCISAILGHLIDTNRQKTQCTVSIIEHSEEHGIFIYLVKDALTDNPKDLQLNTTLPVDSTFKFSIVSSSSGTKGVILVKLDNLEHSLLFELPQGEKLTSLLAEFKRTLQVHTQNAGFGLPSTFTWMEKYVKRESGAINFPVFDASQSSSANEWPFNQIIQLDAGGQCPVVVDDSIQRVSALSDILTSSTSIPTADNTLAIESLAIPTNGPQSMKRRSPDRLLPEPVPTSNRTASTAVGGSLGNRELLAGLLMKQREAEFTQLTNYRVYCGTWNVNGQMPTEDLQTWLSPEEDDPPDIYAIGFQELDLSKNVYILSASPREDEWIHKVEDALPSKAYKKIKVVRLVAMMLVVFVKNALEKYVKDLMAETVGTGLLGMMGNKGGVAVRFRLHDTTVCFVNSHLAAHTEEYERRNQDFRDITSRLIFRTTTDGNSITISDHDVVFWLGDLNYRISDIDSDECKKMITNARIQELMNYDQLCRQMSLRRVFLDYTEGPIKFGPTYKFDPGTDNWDSSDKCRTPAWCDRILWRGENISQLKYRSHPQLKLSDHKPVSSVFDVGIKTCNQILERKVREEIMKMLDQRENEFLPQVSLDMTDVHFDNLKFLESQSSFVTITNTGQVMVVFEFINKPTENHFCKLWLKIDPPKGYVPIGESCSIHLEVCIDKLTAPKLNTGANKIEDILVLHLQGGKDFFITISGSYLPSCFGSSIEMLVHMFSPIREVETADLIQIEQAVINHNSELGKGERPLDIPKELWRIVDSLFKNALEKEELLQVNGLRSEIQQIRDCLDTGMPEVLPGSVYSMVEALLLFLDSLSEPVIPYKFYRECVEANGNLAACKLVLSRIPLSHRNVFKYICAFLRVLLIHSAKNKLDIKILASIFGKIMLRSPPESSASLPSTQDPTLPIKKREEEMKQENFVLTFLLNEYDG